jgi:hypothetical protein
MLNEIEVFRFHLTEPTRKMRMSIQDFKNMKKQKGYEYKAYQIDYNKTIVVYL